MVWRCREEFTMANIQTREATQALIAVLSSAASMGVDIKLLCHWAIDELNDADGSERSAYVEGAIYQIGQCMAYVIDPD
jgi:spore maturation protein SpmB